MWIMIASDGGLFSSGQWANILDAAWESVALIGKIYLEWGPGSSKTISSAGWKIRWRAWSVTFANASTNVRIWIQDVAATGIEDTTYDVYVDYVWWGGGITANAEQLSSMSNGTKTITHLDTVAVIFEMTARWGTDTVSVTTFSSNISKNGSTVIFPYRTNDTGSGPAKNGFWLWFAIEFDDGTLGWMYPWSIIPWWNSSSSLIIDWSSTPDEWAVLFKLPFPCTINWWYLVVGNIATTDNFEIVFYSDPLWTPTAIETLTIDPDFTGSAASISPYTFNLTEYNLAANTWYAFAARPTTVNAIRMDYVNMWSGNDKYMRPFPFWENMMFCSRTNQTGAFSEIQTYYFPLFGVSISKFDDGASGWGGGTGWFFIQ